jgi:PelA/Pel-15E family pectate lyase
MNPRILSFVLVALWSSIEASNLSAQSLDKQEATRALHKVISFYRAEVGYEGAYLWRYSADLTKQEGEGKATKSSGWTQPPGAPAVGEAYLKTWRLSGDKLCLEAATEVAHALVRAQLKSGGWSSHFELAGEGRRRYTYRIDGDKAGKNNYTTFDDDKSQSALTLLMHVDEALGFKEATIHEAVSYALEKMLAAQYPNGAWPQQFSGPPDPAKYPVKKASYPKTWPREYPAKDYRGYYTLNDNNMSHIIDMLFEAQRIYDREDCFAAAEKTGDFFLLAQMPQPQPGWAQQYDLNMHPAWARKFEPASITGGESQSVMRALLNLYRFTGEKKFIKPLPRALAYYRKSELPDGRLARFYELRANRPLYFTKDYKLTYSDADMPTHYGFQVGSRLDSIEREYQQVIAAAPDELKPVHRPVEPTTMSSRLAERAQSVVSALDSRGAWVEEGELRRSEGVREVIEMRTLIKNIEVLAQFVGAVK